MLLGASLVDFVGTVENLQRDLMTIVLEINKRNSRLPHPPPPLPLPSLKHSHISDPRRRVLRLTIQEYPLVVQTDDSRTLTLEETLVHVHTFQTGRSAWTNVGLDSNFHRGRGWRMNDVHWEQDVVRGLRRKITL